MDMRKTLGKFTTAAGTLLFPLYLNDPDDKFDDSKDKMKFKVTLRLEDAHAKALLTEAQTTFDKWLDKVKASTGKKPKTAAKNIQWYTKSTKRWDDIGETTSRMLDELKEGEAVFKMTSKAYKKNSDGTFTPQRPPIFDAEGTLIKVADLPPIGSGSIAKVSGQWYGYTTAAGVAAMSLFFNAVQLLDIHEPGGRGGDNAEDFGFSPTEGFVTEAVTFADSVGEGDDKGGDF